MYLDYFSECQSHGPKLNAFCEEVRRWNEKINLISRKDIGLLEKNHLVPSLAITKVVTFVPGATILDVGTGGGFPGLPLAICCPQAHFVLLDSIQKKVKVLQTICEALELSNVSVHSGRIEDYYRRFDFVLGRAVAPLPQFWEWTKKNISARPSRHSIPSGILYLKGGQFDDELQLVPAKHRIYKLQALLPPDAGDTDKAIVHLFNEASQRAAFRPKA